MRVTLAEMIGVRQFQLPEELSTPLVGFAGSHSTMLNGCFGELVDQAMGRVECGSRTLGNVRDPHPPKFS